MLVVYLFHDTVSFLLSLLATSLLLGRIIASFVLLLVPLRKIKEAKAL
jgi:predicted neutral ceramidase superfamily lipid hydrolase